MTKNKHEHLLKQFMRRQMYIVIALTFAGLVSQAVLPSAAFAAYVTPGTVTSANLLSGTSASSITDFYYNISSLPSTSSVTIQFSTTTTQWYSSANVLNGSDTLSTTGGATLSLSALAASGTAFYYKMTINATSDQSGTPVISNVRLDYVPTSGYGGLLAVSSSGLVGIGTASPSAKLDVEGGNINVGAAGAYLYNSINAIIASTTLNNWFFGGAGNLTATGSNNLGLGTGALLNNTGSGNVALGYGAGKYYTSSNGFFVNNVDEGSTAADKAYSLLYGTFSGSAGSLTGQQLVINGNVGIASTTPASLLSIGNTGGINFTLATSTFSTTGGINLTSGCFAVNGTCVGAGGGGSGTVGTGTTGKFPYYAAGGTTLTATSSIFLAANGNVGIGTTNPSYPLDIGGSGLLANVANTGWYGIGGQLLAYASSTNQDTIFGLGAGGQNATTSATARYNSVFGYQAGSALTTGSGNTANGYQTLYSNTTGSGNTANGIYALYSNTTGYDNTANGYDALYYNTTGTYNTANGMSALNTNTTGTYNTANGYASLYSNTTGYDNTANGYSALNTNTTGTYNTANGTSALASNTTGTNNTAIGWDAGYLNTTGTDSVFVGSKSGASGSGTFTYDTLIGDDIGRGGSVAFSTTTAVGYRAGYNLSGNNGGVFLGNYAGAYELNSNAFYINNIDQTNTAGDKAYSLLYGTFSGSAGSLTGQQLTINAALNLNPNILGTGVGNGSLCMTTAGIVKYSAGANCVSIGSGTNGYLAEWSGTNLVSGVSTTTLSFSGPFTGYSALGALVGGSNSIIQWTGLATTSQPSTSNLLYSTGSAGVAGVATTTPSFGLGFTPTGTWSVLGSSPVLNIATSSLYSGTTGQMPYFSGTNAITATSTGLVTCSGTDSCGTGSYVLGPALTISGNGLSAIGVTTANGVSASSSGGATPSLTISLGAITPTSVNNLSVSTGYGNASDNVAIGGGLSSSSLTGTANLALSPSDLNSDTTGYFNIAAGWQALQNLTVGINNVAIGVYTLNELGSSSTSTDNTAIGYGAGSYYTGYNNLTQLQDSVFVGDGLIAKANGDINEDIYGYGITGNGSNTLTLGNNNITGYYISTNIGAATTGDYLCDNGGSITKGTTCTLSSLKVKNTITPLDEQSGLADIMMLNPVSFYYDKGFGDNGATVQTGLIAESVAEINSLFATYTTSPIKTPNGTIQTGQPDGINWNGITDSLILAVQQLFNHQTLQDQEISQLQREVAQLQAQQPKMVNACYSLTAP